MATAAEFLNSPDDFPLHSQLVRGKVVVNEPEVLHQRLRDFLHMQIAFWCASGTERGEVLSPLDVPIDEINVFAPDVLWFSEARRPPRSTRYLRTVPDLAIEVRSLSTWRYDIGPKRERYEANGLRELWLVDSASRTVIVNRRSAPDKATYDVVVELGEGETLTTSLMPGLAIDIAELFDR